MRDFLGYAKNVVFAREKPASWGNREMWIG